MRRAQALPLALIAAFSAGPLTQGQLDPPITAPNPNTAPAGVRHDSVLTLDLDAVEARWHEGGGAVPGTRVLAFAERGRQPTIPGPLVRVPAGTTVRVSLHNTLARQITFFLPTSPATDDSVIVAAGATGELSVRASAPGNYVYRATDGSRSAQRVRIAGALTGMMVVDTAGAPAVPGDRILAIVMVPDSMMTAYVDSAGVLTGARGAFAFTINGLSWPYTERVALTVGDTVHWRLINATWDVHPMHLHGFYYRVDEFTGLTADRDGQGEPGRMVVTERMSPFSAMRITWAPERPGNWLLHCHFSLHLVPPAPASGVGEEDAGVHMAAHDNHALTGMAGLVVGITVRPRPGDRLAAAPRPARRLRILVTSDSGFPERRPSERYVIEENGRRTTSSHPGFSPSLYLVRNQPVAITVVNQLAEYTAVHWHGMELESYYDGVAGLSGAGDHIAPMIAPGDSFTARFTPPRAGTFMYHTHVDDVRQQRAGLVGAMIVRDGGPAAPVPDDYEFFLKGSMDRNGAPLDIDGLPNPDTLVLRAGRPARLRFMSLTIVNPSPAVVITARADSVGGNVRDTLLASWVPVAKDGADLPAAARRPREARQIISMGETYDFTFTPPAAGSRLRLEVRGGGGNGALLGRIPIRVE